MITRNIITMSPKNTGVGRYISDLLAMKNVTQEIYTIIRTADNAHLDYFGKMVRGKEIPGLPSNWYFQNNFPKIAYHRFQKEIKKGLNKRNILFHYSDCFQTRFTPMERSLVTVHDIFVASEKYAKKYNYKINRFNIKNLMEFLKMENLIVDSNFVKNDLLDLGYEFEPKVVYLSYGRHMKKTNDRNALRKKFGLPLNKTLIISVSSNDPRKNIKSIPETLDRLDKNKFNVIRVGPPLQGAYNFNNLSNEEVNDLYNASDLLLFPSLDEGFGYPLIESMSIGLPIVASDIEVVREICSNAALLVEPNSRAFSTAIREVVERKEEMSALSLSRSVNFSPEIFEKNIEKIYKEILVKLDIETRTYDL